MRQIQRTLAIGAIAVALTAGVAACADDDAEPAADGDTTAAPTMAEAVTDPTVIAQDFSFEVEDTWAAGPQTIGFENQGEEPHELVAIKLDEGKTIEDVQEVIAEDPNAEPPSWVQIVGGTFAKPGQSAKKPLEADMQPGTYVLLCFVESEANDGQPHAALGMVKEITVA